MKNLLFKQIIPTKYKNQTTWRRNFVLQEKKPLYGNKNMTLEENKMKIHKTERNKANSALKYI